MQKWFVLFSTNDGHSKECCSMFVAGSKCARIKSIIYLQTQSIYTYWKWSLRACLLLAIEWKALPISTANYIIRTQFSTAAIECTESTQWQRVLFEVNEAIELNSGCYWNKFHWMSDTNNCMCLMMTRVCLDIQHEILLKLQCNPSLHRVSLRNDVKINTIYPNKRLKYMRTY